MSFFGFSSSCTVDIQFSESARRLVEIKSEGTIQKIPLFFSKDNVKGKVIVNIPAGKRIEHNGCKLELIGQIEMFYDRGNHYEFTSVVKELASASILSSSIEYPFEFNDIDKQYESHNGINVRLRYFLRFVIDVKKALTNIVKESDFWVYNHQTEPEINNSIKMEVGIEEALHIEFEYNKSKYHLRDVVIGKIYFLLVRIKIKHMEIALIRRESTGSGPNLYNENETLTKFEIMDGAPARGESIPIRLFLSGFDLTPTYRNVHGKFSVRYYLNLVLVDEDDRRYFKQQEIMLWRKG
eukprot:TRINITY_DN1842_c0_g1_i1.p1 TRINITY_DN1842_c0_g1~~TRINITY_DN1842_c0_g1_i1.p1  ORF type:complete len:296 (-),score=108.90 TRINITY_DN1842_c0_g1_i1:128-1015(-)